MTGPEHREPEWHAALAYALTGAWVAVSPVREPDLELLVEELAERGWDGSRLAETARRRPPLPDGWVRELGAARFAAVLADLRRRVGASGATHRGPAPARALDPDERRLVADRPPHWG